MAVQHARHADPSLPELTPMVLHRRSYLLTDCAGALAAATPWQRHVDTLVPPCTVAHTCCVHPIEKGHNKHTGQVKKTVPEALPAATHGSRMHNPWCNLALLRTHAVCIHTGRRASQTEQGQAPVLGRGPCCNQVHTSSVIHTEWLCQTKLTGSKDCAEALAAATHGSGMHIPWHHLVLWWAHAV